jgi:hypothetical protein
MARGQEGKLRRRTQRKGERDGTPDDPIDMFGEDNESLNSPSEGDLPLPPSMKAAAAAAQESMPKKKTKKATSAAVPVQMTSKKSEGIKTMPLIFLLVLTGTTLLPLFIYAGDWLAAHNALGQVGFRLGIGQVPRRRVLSFYEKHAPEKLDQVPTILAKNYGEYPVLLKKLERKYQDYGYFIGWEQDEAPMTLALEKLQSTYQTWIRRYVCFCG